MKFLVVALVLAMSSTAWATPCPKAQPVKAGVPAPCSGVVLPRSDLGKALQCMKVDLPGCKAARTKDQREAEARERDFKRKLDAERARANLLDEQLKKVAAIDPPERGWWEHPAFVGGLSFAVGVAVTVGVYELLKR